MRTSDSETRAQFWSDVLITFARLGLPPGELIMIRMLGDVCDGITFRYASDPQNAHRTITAPMLERGIETARRGPIAELPEWQRSEIVNAACVSDADMIDGTLAAAVVRIALSGAIE